MALILALRRALDSLLLQKVSDPGVDLYANELIQVVYKLLDSDGLDV